jgi:hypothetical protein
LLKKEPIGGSNRGYCQDNDRRRNKSQVNSNCQRRYKRESVDEAGNTDGTRTRVKGKLLEMQKEDGRPVSVEKLGGNKGTTVGRLSLFFTLRIYAPKFGNHRVR